MAMAMAMEENGMKNKIRVAVLFGSLVFGFQLKIVKFTVKVFKRERKVAHGNNNNNTSAFCGVHATQQINHVAEETSSMTFPQK